MAGHLADMSEDDYRKYIDDVMTDMSREDLRNLPVDPRFAGQEGLDPSMRASDEEYWGPAPEQPSVLRDRNKWEIQDEMKEI